MIRACLIVLLVLLAAGCTTGRVAPKTASAPTLDSGPFPSPDIEKLAAPKIWRLLHDLPCSGYAVLSAISADGVIQSISIQENFPGKSRDAIAAALTRRVHLPGSVTGSNIPPPVTIYVIFYDGLALGENVALVYAVQMNRQGVGPATPRRFLEIMHF